MDDRVIVPPSSIEVRVMAGGPVFGADVHVWALKEDGQRFGLLAHDVTDSNGHLAVDLKPWIGVISIEVTDGYTYETWDPGTLTRAQGVLRSVITDFIPSHGRVMTVSPFTTLAAALGDSRAAHGELDYIEAMRSAYEDLGKHLGDVSLTDSLPASMAEPVLGLIEPVRHGIMHATFERLARRIADETGAIAPLGSTLALTHALVHDARDAGALFDGLGLAGQVRVGDCPAAPVCDPDDPDDPDDPEACARPLCQLSASTLRTDMTNTLAFFLLDEIYDPTTLIIDDVRLIAHRLHTNPERELFGDAEPEPLIESLRPGD